MTVTGNEISRSRDLPGWIATPVATLVLAPAVAISLGILVAESSTSYPAICDSSASTNGCQETVFGMIALHARFFLVGWLLLWALPWWRSLRPYRIAAAVVVALVLISAPLRLLGSVSIDGLFSVSHWDGIIRDPARTSQEVSQLADNFFIAGLVIVAVPVAVALWFAVRRRRTAAVVWALVAAMALVPAYGLARLSYHASDRERQLQRTPDPNPPCQVHSGSNDVCPGG